MLPLNHALTYCLCTVDCLLLLYFILFSSKLEYTLPAWNIMAANVNKLECAQWQFAALSLSQFFSHIPYNYAVALELLQLHTVQVIRRQFDDLFIVHVLPRSKFCSSMICNSSFQVPSCNIRSFTQFSAGHNNCPSTYLLTPYSTVLLDKLTSSAASQEIPHIFGTRRFLTVLTSAHHLSLS